MSDISQFLAKSPSIPEILKFIDEQAKHIAKERKKQKAGSAET